MPDRPKGRGKETACTAVKGFALDHGIPVFTPPSLKRFPEEVERIRAFHPDFLVVVAYGLILSREVLAIPRLGAVNLHASLLPKHRGPSPIHAVIIGGEQVSGNTVMLMGEKMDAGDILASQEVAIGPDEEMPSLHDRLSEAGAGLLVETLREFARGGIVPRPQEHDKATYCGKITPETARLNWGEPAESLRNLCRAMVPSPGAWFEVEGQRIKVGRASVGAGTGKTGSSAPVPGSVLVADPQNGLVVACGNGTLLRLLTLQRPGKSMMPVSDFLRGFPFPWKILS